MSKYKHKKYQPTNFLLGQSDIFNDNLKSLLQHETNQFNEAMKSGDTRDTWQSFKAHLDLCSTCFEKNDFQKAMYHFYWLGFYAKETGEFFTPTEAVQAYDALIQNLEKGSTFILKNKYLSLLQESAIEVATILWSYDEWKNTPASTMGAEVRRMLVEEKPETLAEIKKHIPKFVIPAVGQYIKWVRKAKPPHLTKGRPPKL